jgi:hypothetical protein
MIPPISCKETAPDLWKRMFGNRPIGQITLSELQDWQTQKRAINKPATVNLMLGRLRHMFKRAIEGELLDESPLRRIKFLRENNARLRDLAMIYQELLISWFKGTTFGQKRPITTTRFRRSGSDMLGAERFIPVS